MSNNKLIIKERSKNLGDFIMGRVLPFHKKRLDQAKEDWINHKFHTEFPTVPNDHMYIPFPLN